MDLEVLLKHRGWAQALAAQLLDDASAADDVLQDVWLAARKNPPRDPDAVVGWVSSVVRNLSRMRRRTDARRREREEAAAVRAGAVSSGEDVLEGVEVQRWLSEALLSLSDPYRTVIALRYYEDLTAVEIAKRQGTPAATIRSQLRRGLEQLRTKLEGDSRVDQRDWTLSLLPLGLRHLAGTAESVGVLSSWVPFMKVAGPAVLLVVLAFWVASNWNGVGSEPGTARSATPSTEASTSVPTKLEEHASDSDGVTVRHAPHLDSTHAEPAPTPATPVAVDSAEEAVRLVGVVHDLRGQPVRGVEVRLQGRPSGPFARTDRRGRFELQTPLTLELVENSFASGVVVDSKHYLTVCAAPTTGTLGHDNLLIVVAPTLEYSGEVLDQPTRRPIGGVLVVVQPEIHDFIEYPSNDDLARTRMHVSQTRSDSDGRFRLRIPAMPTRVNFMKEDYRTAIHTVVEDTPPSVITLLPEQQSVTIFGRVRHENGSPAEGARVHHTNRSAECQRNGTFELVVKSLEHRASLVATLAGQQAAIADMDALIASTKDGRCGPVEFVLGPEPLDLRVRVQDHAGRPVVGWPIGLSDATVISWNRTPRTTAEQLSADGSNWSLAVTDHEGAYRFRGLSDREYRVWVGEHATQLRVHSPPTHPSVGELVLTIPEDAYVDRLEGVVVDREGSPCVGVTVQVVRHERVNEAVHGSFGAEATTDDDGRFLLERVPSRGVSIQVDGPGIAHQTYEVEKLGLEPEVPGDAAPLVELRVLRQHKVRYFSRALQERKAEYARIECLDAEGDRLQLMVRTSGGWSTSAIVPLTRGVSPVFEVSEAIDRIVVREATQVIGEVAFTPSLHDEITEVQGP